MRRITIAATSGLLAAGLLTATPALAGSGPAAGTSGTTAGSAVNWGACPKSYPDLQNTSVKCAALKVPLDYSKPHGKQISIEVSLLPHTSSSADYKGYLLTNPGGPGGAGLDLPYYLQSAVPNHVGDDFDWIGFDPRGVGASKPRLTCKPDYFKGPRKPYDPTSAKILNYWLQRSKAYAAACAHHNPGLLHNMTTPDSARDMNSIRKALGVAKISYYGFSYGTYLGQVFGTLFPSHLDRMVLDSSVDPKRVWQPANFDQDRAFDRNAKIYFKWVAKYHKVYGLGKTEKAVQHDYYSTLARLDRHPKGQLGGDEFTDVILEAGYYQLVWEQVTSAWSKLHKGHPADITSQYKADDGVGDDNEFAVYNGVQCSDAHWPGVKKTLAENRKLAKKAPFETWGNAWFNAPCLYWHVKPRTPITVNGDKVSSALLIDETDDAATPYPGSLVVRKLFPHSSLIAEPGGTTHADTLFGDACVDNKIADYLSTGKRPARQNWNGPDALCKPLPKPDPTGAQDGASPDTARPVPTRLLTRLLPALALTPARWRRNA
jgi:pimeloyl-ACP methyl ester carboxylesterase